MNDESRKLLAHFLPDLADDDNPNYDFSNFGFKQVFVILWLGQPFVFSSYEGAKKWLLDKLPDLSDIELRMSIYQKELIL